MSGADWAVVMLATLGAFAVVVIALALGVLAVMAVRVAWAVEYLAEGRDPTQDVPEFDPEVTVALPDVGLYTGLDYVFDEGVGVDERKRRALAFLERAQAIRERGR